MAARKPKNKALKHIKVSKYSDHEWEFEYPRLTFKTMETLHDTIEIYHSGEFGVAQKRFKEMIKKFPEFIDAYHHLALLLDHLDQHYESFNLVKTATEIGLSSLPPNFYFGRDLLPWINLENRPFLRAYHFYGLKFLNMDETEKALCIFNNILDLNPNDNQGIRALAIDCYLSLKRPLDALRVAEKYPDDALADIQYGKILALYQLGRIKEAEQCLEKAVDLLPLVAKEILKRQHRKPKNINSSFITRGGADEAYSFWQSNSKLWKETPGAINFVREFLSENSA